MKKIKYFMFATAALLFAACSSDDAIVEKQSPQTDVENNAVEFSAYLNRGTTRAGWAGELTTNTGEKNLTTEGFGVFGYYTNNELYSESSKPNFMYNQKVSGANWTYSPIKYWPNEFGSEAISDAQDKLTFFAYAPWVEVEPTTGLLKDQTGGKNTSGIVALTRNTASGDPFVKYFVDMKPANRVDLCWGVAAETFTSSVVAGLNNIEAGKTYKDVSKPEVSSKIKFDFNHALASLNVQIDADIDQDEHGTNALDAKTQIFVRSVTFEGFASKGMFNLNADKTAPKWYDLTGINELTNGKVTIYDGRRDGSEGQGSAEASNETPKDLNTKIVQSYDPVKLSSTEGVPSNADPVNLFNSTNVNEPIYVIPTNEPLKVTIVYDVETADPNLAAYLSDGKTKGSSIENTITKEITIDGGNKLQLVAGKKHIVKLHLGMTSVKFEASVTDWGVGDEGGAWLPINNGTSVVAASTAPYTSFNTTVDYSGGTVEFSINGLTSGEAVTRSGLDFVNTSWITATTASTDGVSNVTVAIPANTTTSKKTGGAQVVGGTSSTGAVVNITQDAHPLGLGATSLAAGGTEITLSSEATGVTWTTANITFKKIKGGNETTLVKDTHFTVDSDGKIAFTLGSMSAAASGDKYIITVQSGDAAAETLEITVP